MSSPAPVAGPSRLGYTLTPSRYLDSPSMYRPAPSTSSRSSTPLYPNGARFRSGSVFNREQFKKEEITRKRQESRNRLRSSWDLLFEKYRAVEDDDEIDLVSGEVVKDRGKLRAVEGRDFGDITDSDEDGDGSSALDGPEAFEFESDEDEIGDWDDRSGLDPQIPDLDEVEEEETQRPAWTIDDQHDYEEFMRAEAMRRRDSDDEEDEDRVPTRQARTPSPYANSDLDLEDHVSPRSRGTRILPLASLEDLFRSDGEEEEPSEDELAITDRDSDDEILRFTPLASGDSRLWRAESHSSSSRSKTTLEVVIPTRSRSLRPTTLSSSSFNSSPTRPPLRDLTYKSLMRPASSPSLSDLFSTPPPASSSRLAESPRPSSPSTHARSPVPSLLPDALVPSIHTRVIRDSKTSLPRFAASSKGKERMDGERPDDLVEEAWGTPNSPYHKNIWRTRNGGAHACKHCKVAGGERERRAPWCRGRKGDCWFEPVTADPSRLDSSLPPNTAPALSTKLASAPDPVTPSPDLHSARRTATSSASIRRRKSRACRPCSEAGGERADKATLCKGRKSWKICPFEWKEHGSGSETENGPVDDLASLASGGDRGRTGSLGETVTPAAPPVTHPASASRGDPKDKDEADNVPFRRSASRRAPLTESESDDLQSVSESEMPPRRPNTASASTTLPVRPPDLDPTLYSEGFSYATTGLPRRCKQCRIAGGNRMRNAWWCKGRTWTKYCSFIQSEQAERKSTTESEEISVAVVSNNELDMPSVAAMFDVAARPPPNPVRTRLRRGIRTASEPNSPNRTSAVSPARMTVPLSPPPSSVPPSSPPAINASENSRPALEVGSASPISSLPPSSPPNPPTSYFLQSRRTVHPTPSPTVSVAAVTDDPSNPTPIAQTKFYRSIMPLPGSTISCRPTPPPSVDGMRSLSISSDILPLTEPRKSALRRPSDTSAPRSSSSSVKRARFSLQPRSPPREASSDPLRAEDDSSEDELALGCEFGSSSPVTIAQSSSPAFTRYASSSSPLRNEWTVRAADVGFKLGPEHTGRVPARMVQALAPSLSAYRPTLGSSLLSGISQMVSSPVPYATPPPSFASTSSSGSNRGLDGNSPIQVPLHATTKSSTPTTAGLMLPPPVPMKRLETVRRSSTPSEASSSQSPVPIKFTSLPAAVVRAHARANARSRSRSVSIASYSTSAIEKDRFATPSQDSSRRRDLRETLSTPTRKTRVMRSLARVAREVGDEAGLEWGLDEEADDGGRMWREGSVATYVG
ncbi:hypothetical protein IAR55_006835 [Kwoniella newhampshirensis]|uniref:Uncharacterized protein n=1 Tax=Kwoniella newhampshirensis TaxID=1651941 RepID=A0AAW0YTD3_9TREE